ncbi:hypothetical protein LO763_22570 [Glycomyces sp. A-F 0318]|uniref:hypothetical protein n=1 Tax=Glycomyces amatae TaxID=2881355 RepID=UPI001E62B079|nr:hypothetical protein [Glycomyces amatae]MCD0446404.1 hypothetical protein [Glycomyces amatae]
MTDHLKGTRAVVKLPPALAADFTAAAASVEARAPELIGAFIAWWCGEGRPPVRPEWSGRSASRDERLSVTVPLPTGVWEQFGALADHDGFTRGELVTRFARWYVGRDSLPPRH